MVSAISTLFFWGTVLVVFFIAFTTIEQFDQAAMVKDLRRSIDDLAPSDAPSVTAHASATPVSKRKLKPGVSPSLGGSGASAQTKAAGGEDVGKGSPKTMPKMLPWPGQGKCHVMQNSDLWGDVVVWGNDNRKDSAEECCQSCADHVDAEPLGCTVWVWCGDESRCGADYKACWLKHLPWAQAVVPRQGPEIPWTAGVQLDDAPVEEDPLEDRKYHYVISAQGSAVHWQARVAYYHFKKQKAACEAEWGDACTMGGFTRLLHSGHPDDLMDEIPTFVVDPIPADKQNNQGYVVLNRPFAFVQWAEKAKIPEKYVLMAEPDHILLRPLPNLMRGDRLAAFPFFYIEPYKPDFRAITQKFTGPLTVKELETIAPIGNSPTFISMGDLRKVAPVWMNTSIAIFNDDEAHGAWGWVLEMYGFTIACHIAEVGPVDLYLKMMSQPPWDVCQEGGSCPFYTTHYTYGMDYTLAGEFTPGKIGAWRFDKRTYASRPPPRNLELPPAGMKNELVRGLIKNINEASEALPNWDEYVEKFNPAAV